MLLAKRRKLAPSPERSGLDTAFGCPPALPSRLSPGPPRPRILRECAQTIRQPWASLIICGEKDVENRTGTTRYRGVLAIHAAHRFDQDLQPWQRSIAAKVDAFPRGAIIGVVELIDIVRDSTSRWAEPTCYHWVLANPRAVAPVPVRGRLGLWTPEVGIPA
jgi:hypothetical protein